MLICLIPVSAIRRSEKYCSNNNVQITMQGSRQRDFTQAYKAAGIPRNAAPDYTWHHLNDFNPKTGTTTMQLIKKSVHYSSIPHSGSVAQFAEHFHVQYGSRKAVAISQEKEWMKGRAPRYRKC